MRKGIYYDNKRKSWYIHTSLKGRTITIRGFATKKEADENYDLAVDKWKRDHNFSANDGVFESILENYYQFREHQITKQSVDKIKTEFRTYWSPIFKGQPINSIYNIERLKLLYNNIVNNQSLNARKKYNVVRIFLDFSKYCYLQRLINEDIYQQVKVIFQPFKYVKNKDNGKRVIPQSEIKAFLDAICHSSKDYAMFSLFVALGARISEFLAICYDCVDFENNKITIKRQLLVNGELTDQLKTKQSYRIIPVSVEKIQLIRRKDTGRLFNISHTTFKRKLKEYEKKAGIPLYASHEFRHTKAFNMAKKCSNISEVVYCAKVLGHNVDMFLNTYCSHLDNSLESKFLD